MEDEEKERADMMEGKEKGREGKGSFPFYIHVYAYDCLSSLCPC